MNIDTKIIENILSGHSLRLVLHPRNNVQTDFPDMYESFDLRHIILKDQKFFAKTANKHAIPFNFGKYNTEHSFSYAYSNYYSYVVNSSHASNIARIYNKNVYENFCFTPIKNFALVWDSEKDKNIKLVEDAVSSGCLLKIALLDKAGYWNIHPVHMSSFFINKNYFELFTDQDSVPIFLHDEDSLEMLEKKMKNRLKEAVRDLSPRNLREVFDKAGFFSKDPKFYSTFYTIRSNGKYIRARTDLNNKNAQQDYLSLRVFADNYHRLDINTT